MLAKIVSRTKLWMIQGGSSLRLTVEAAQCLQIWREPVGKKLQGNEAMWLGVFELTRLRTIEASHTPLSRDKNKCVLILAKNMVTKEIAAIGEGGYFDSASRGCSQLYCRAMTRNALPLSTGHLYPRIGPLDIQVNCFA